MSAVATARATRPAATRRSAVSWGGSPAAGERDARGLQHDEAGTSRPRLRVVTGAAPARTTLPFLALIILVLAGALVASMLLNARMADTAYRMKEAQVELNVLNDHVETLRTDVQEASAPDSLATRASERGMVPAGAPGVVDLERSTLTEGASAGDDADQAG
ncbi:hypothetical protein [Actinomyces wuliandei]|uniref:hypothetical protein n=1 Tax=Actinomyces wuliandei TaxID=2057743 RepID=UPI000FD88B7D|nr:hypothetical protein [Actinomyces wuliandei]